MSLPNETLLELARGVVDRDQSQSAVAQRMFGATMPQPEKPDPAAPVTPAPAKEGAQTPATPAAPATRSDDELADKLFSSPETLRSMYEPSLKASIDRLNDRTGWTQEQRDTYTLGVAEIFHDMRTPSDQAALLHGLITHNIESPPADAQRLQWEAETRKEMRERYGLDEANRRLALAKEFVQARPALAQLLESSGVGSHPRFVMPLAERVGELRMQPRKRG